MSTLYGTLVGHLARDYEVQTSVMHENAGVINQFGEAVKNLGLLPHVSVQQDKTLRLCAATERGQAVETVLAALEANGYTLGERTRLPQQFVNDYEMWTVQVKGRTLSFALLYYIKPGDV